MAGVTRCQHTTEDRNALQANVLAPSVDCAPAVATPTPGRPAEAVETSRRSDPHREDPLVAIEPGDARSPVRCAHGGAEVCQHLTGQDGDRSNRGGLMRGGGSICRVCGGHQVTSGGAETGNALVAVVRRVRDWSKRRRRTRRLPDTGVTRCTSSRRPARRRSLPIRRCLRTRSSTGPRSRLPLG